VGKILIGAENAQYLGNDFTLEPAGELRIEGVAEPVSAFFFEE
jgi:class 3 adenylate cyclase